MSKIFSLLVTVALIIVTLGINLVMAAVNKTDNIVVSNTDPWGITVTAENITQTGLTYKITQSGGNVKGNLETGTPFKVERYENEEWEELPYINENLAWTMPAFLIKQNDVTEFEVNWEFVYGKLGDGKYRISKEISDFIVAEEYETKEYYAEFYIGEKPLVEISLSHPCPDCKISREFAVRENPATGEKIRHNGIDFVATEGMNVYSATDGEVLSVVFDPQYGNTVLIKSKENNVTTFYGHLKTVYVKSGDKVTKKQVIATVGNTGMSTGPHLHFEVKVNGEYADSISLR